MWQVELITESEKTGKIKQYEYSCENMVEVTRLMLTFKPSRGYRLCQVMVVQWV
jgi:hypothetical protein